MKELLDKLSSYNIFNFLLPGILFAIIADQITNYSLIQDDLVLGVFLYYFIGLVISRIGSLFIEPILIRLKMIQYSEYKDFVIASGKDKKLEILLEINNVYRSLCSLFFSLLILAGYEKLEKYLGIKHNWTLTILAIFMLILFLFSFKKQTAYIRKRVEASK